MVTPVFEILQINANRVRATDLPPARYHAEDYTHRGTGIGCFHIISSTVRQLRQDRKFESTCRPIRVNIAEVFQLCNSTYRETRLEENFLYRIPRCRVSYMRSDVYKKQPRRIFEVFVNAINIESLGT